MISLCTWDEVSLGSYHAAIFSASLLNLALFKTAFFLSQQKKLDLFLSLIEIQFAHHTAYPFKLYIISVYSENHAAIPIV